MRKSLMLLPLGLFMASTSALAGSWAVAPVAEGGFELDPIVSVMYGQATGDDSGAEATNIMGVELDFNCLLLQSPDGNMRQHFSITQMDDDGSKATFIEINPHYKVEVVPDVKIGAGPGFGYIMTSSDGTDISI